MVNKNDELLKKLLALFQVEAEAHLQVMSSSLLALEKIPVGGQCGDIIETVFREAHSLKGAARAVNLTQIETVCQSLESVLSALKDKRLAISPPLVDLLLQTVDFLGGLLVADKSLASTQKSRGDTLARQLDDALRSPLPEFTDPAPVSWTEPPAPAAVPAAVPPATAPTEPGPDMARQGPASAHTLASATVRVSAAKLDAVVRQVEELLLPRLAAGQRAKELGEAAAALAGWKKQWLNIQPALRLVDRELAHSTRDSNPVREKYGLPGLLKYLDAEQLHMKELEDHLMSLQRAAEQDQRMLTSMIDGLRQDVKEMQLLPFSSLLAIFPRFSRELAREQGKNVKLVTRGGEIEIDRHILEEIKDPLIHLLRNCIDHGIEQPAARLAKGKPQHGTITLACLQKDSGMAEIIVADDGAGIDVSRVKAAAQRLGIISAEEMEQLGEPESIGLAFQSGVTTRPTITDISGRGIGLAIVREKIERLGGSIMVKSDPDHGTAFHLLLPLTLANFRGVLVHAGKQLFVIPSTSVERVVQVARKEIRTVKNRETILMDEQAVSLVWLSDVLELPRNIEGVAAADAANGVTAVVLGSGLARVAFLVEEILGEQEVLVKTLVRPLTRVRNVAGASVLGSGRVVPVLNAADLLKSAARHPAASPASGYQLPIEKREAARKLSILVVEDSITSRVLLKTILESAGYRITTAVDGVDGYTALKTGTFDLVVSDVEMPRMDGFGLTAKIRADKQLARLPVVLVTALESREYREHGIDAGANAYIVKSSFDQSNLLETVQRLIGISA